MKKVPPSAEGNEPNDNLRYPRPGDTVFCASVPDVSVIGRVSHVNWHGQVRVEIGNGVTLTTNEANLDVVFRPRKWKEF